MKLGKVTNNDKPERLALSIRSSVVKDLNDYREFYKSETGEEISMSLLVEEMLKRFMAEDKAFQKFKKAPSTAGSAPSASSAPSAASMTGF